METEKIRNLTAEELVQQEKDSMDRFSPEVQMKMGQTRAEQDSRSAQGHCAHEDRCPST